MPGTDKQANPDRYRDDIKVFNSEHGWGRTINPRVGSHLVDIKFEDGKIISLNENEVHWPITYNDKCVAFGSKLTNNDRFAWFYSPNEKLEGKSPKDAIDDNQLEKVEEIFDQTFGS